MVPVLFKFYIQCVLKLKKIIPAPKSYTERDVIYQERKELLSLDDHQNLPRIYKLCTWRMNRKEGGTLTVLRIYITRHRALKVPLSNLLFAVICRRYRNLAVMRLNCKYQPHSIRPAVRKILLQFRQQVFEILNPLVKMVLYSGII